MRPPKPPSPADETDPPDSAQNNGEEHPAEASSAVPPDYSTWSVKELKQALARAGVNHAWANTKEDLVSLARERRVRPAPGFGDDDAPRRDYSWEPPDYGSNEDDTPIQEAAETGAASGALPEERRDNPAEQERTYELPAALGDAHSDAANTTRAPIPVSSPATLEAQSPVPRNSSLMIQVAEKEGGRAAANSLSDAAPGTPAAASSANAASGAVNASSSAAGRSASPAPFALPSAFPSSRTGSPAPLSGPSSRAASPLIGEPWRKGSADGSKRSSGAVSADKIKGSGNGADLVYGISDVANASAVALSGAGGAVGNGNGVRGWASGESGADPARSNSFAGGPSLAGPLRPNGGAGQVEGGGRRDAAVFETVLSRRASPGPRSSPGPRAPPAAHAFPVADGPGDAVVRGGAAPAAGAAPSAGTAPGAPAVPALPGPGTAKAPAPAAGVALPAALEGVGTGEAAVEDSTPAPTALVDH